LRALGAEPLAYDDERVEQLGAAVAFDPVGGIVFERSLAALAPSGRLVTPGAVDSLMVSLNLWLVIGKQARIIGTSATSVTNEEFERLIELAGNGELTPVIDRALPLAEAAEAHRLIEAREVSARSCSSPKAHAGWLLPRPLPSKIGKRSEVDVLPRMAGCSPDTVV
jgi:NADPH:quinone reductase-like Zn-dependent oxidoreductase